MQNHTFSKKGFTIVELLIVIVVIGILAAIVIVAYNGVQDRAKVSKVQGDLRSVQMGLQQYYAINGEYPATGTAVAWSWRYSCPLGIANFIPGVTNASSAQAPCTDGTSSNDTWLYGSDGQEYKLIHLRARFSDAARDSIPVDQRDMRWSSFTTAWGYWSGGAATR